MSVERADEQSPPRIPARVWKMAAVTGAGAFMAMLDSTVVNLAVESVRDEFGSTIPVVQWIVTGYLVALAVSLPATGWLGSRYGYGRVWTVSLAAFVVASALCALAPGVELLILARLMQGLAAGLMVPAGQAVIGAAAGPKQLGRLFAVIGVVVSLGPALGPAVGGLLLDFASWRWLFWINVPIGVAALAFARTLVPAGSVNTDRPLDLRGLFLLGVGLPALLYGATEFGSAGASAAPIIAVAVGVVMSVGFVLTALRASNPLIELRLLRDRTFAVATATTGLTGANMFGGLLLLPLYLQIEAGFGGADTGLMLLAMGLGSAAALYVGGAMTDRYGAGPVILAGAGLLILTTIPFLFPYTPPTVALVLILVGRGVGIAWAQMPAMTAAYESVSEERIGDAATLVNIVQRVGGAVGAAGVVIVLSNASGDVSYAWAFSALAAVSALTLASAEFLRRSPSG